jgi:hypothetical protein
LKALENLRYYARTNKEERQKQREREEKKERRTE